MEDLLFGDRYGQGAEGGTEENSNMDRMTQLESE